MRYPHLEELEQLVVDKLASKRPHPEFPLFIYNYTPRAVHKTIAEWSDALCDARGLILDSNGEIIGRPFRKFWNYEQVLHQIPDEPFTITEKLDGSLGIVCSYDGNQIVATRGSFESDQAFWVSGWLETNGYGLFLPKNGWTYLFEIIYPENRIVVDYGGYEGLKLLAVMAQDGKDVPGSEWTTDHGMDFDNAKTYDGITDFATVNSDPQFQDQEGFVVRWASGFRAKVKAEEYKRLHRLITQCSTRTIWELLRAGKGIGELLDRVPEEFKEWVNQNATDLKSRFTAILNQAVSDFSRIGNKPSRKELASQAVKQAYPSLLFGLLDGKPIDDMIWKIIEPKWATPFRGDEF